MSSPPCPPQRIAFFDLDRTLVPEHTALLYLRLLMQEGRVGWFTMVQAMGYLTLYFLNMVDTEKVVRAVVARARGDDDAEGRARGERCVEALVMPRVSAPALRCVEDHRARGDALCILSASPEYVVGPLARRLGMDFECTRLAADGGRLTGELLGPLCFGAHKLRAAELYARALDVNLQDCFFYSDSASDLPLLERVGHPVAVNPDPWLRRVARERRWRIDTFR